MCEGSSEAHHRGCVQLSNGERQKDWILKINLKSGSGCISIVRATTRTSAWHLSVTLPSNFRRFADTDSAPALTVRTADMLPTSHLPPPGSHWQGVAFLVRSWWWWCQHSYAIKNHLKEPKAPVLGPLLAFTIYLVLYGTRQHYNLSHWSAALCSLELLTLNLTEQRAERSVSGNRRWQPGPLYRSAAWIVPVSAPSSTSSHSPAFIYIILESVYSVNQDFNF